MQLVADANRRLYNATRSFRNDNFLLFVLTVLWTPIARKLSAVEQRQRGSKWVPFFSVPVSTALLIPIFCGFTAFVALPLIAIIQDRLPLERCFFYL